MSLENIPTPLVCLVSGYLQQRFGPKKASSTTILSTLHYNYMHNCTYMCDPNEAIGEPGPGLRMPALLVGVAADLLQLRGTHVVLCAGVRGRRPRPCSHLRLLRRSRGQAQKRSLQSLGKRIEVKLQSNFVQSLP